MTAMTDAQLRAKIRELMAAGVLPSEPAPIQRPVPPAPTGPKPHMFVRDSLLDQACMICGQLAPQFQFFYVGGVVVQVHAVCGDLKTKDENGRQLKISDGRDAWDTEPETSVGHTPRLWSSNVLP